MSYETPEVSAAKEAVYLILEDLLEANDIDRGEDDDPGYVDLIYWAEFIVEDLRSNGVTIPEDFKSPFGSDG